MNDDELEILKGRILEIGVLLNANAIDALELNHGKQSKICESRKREKIERVDYYCKSIIEILENPDGCMKKYGFKPYR